MTSDESPLTYILKQNPFPQPDTHALTQILHFQFRQVPYAFGRFSEAYRKACVPLFCFAAIPEILGSFPGAFRKLVWRCCFI